MDRIQLYTDLTYGVLLVVALVVILASGQTSLLVGFGIGVFTGYAVHVGSKMVEFSEMMESVETVEETVEDVDDRVGDVEDRVADVGDDVEATRETVEEVGEKTDEVERAVNGGSTS